MLVGAKLGAYEVVAKLGEGGMGEVYRATDTRLKRQVAIKVLPEALASDPDRLARFQREAEVVASLNHPYIAAVYGLEETDGVKAIVMELVEGMTLADRIAQGPIPFDEALPIAARIAEALQAAHEQGIVHRDLKPANVKVREDGAVKVLDFGLAKLADAGAIRDDAQQAPAVTRPTAVTGIGMIVGTAAYMSPEQARGRPVDRRTDVWAFGAVLFEMVTGARAFDGEDVTEVMASVVKSAPNWALIPTDVPPHVVTLMQRCLEKDRNARIGDMAVARFLLEGHATFSAPAPASSIAPAAPPATASRVTSSTMVPWMVAAVLAVVAAAASMAWLRGPRQTGTRGVSRLQMTILPADSLTGSIGSTRPSRTSMALSPDGRTIVFAATRGPVSQLYVRQLDREEATPLPGTDNATWPFFSPDAAWIGFMADGKLKKMRAAGGLPSTIGDVAGPARGWGAEWGNDGTIVFAGSDGIAVVPADGGKATPVAIPVETKGERYLLPHWLPDGKAILVTVSTSNDWDTSSVVLVSRQGGDRRTLMKAAADARYVNGGYLLFMKSGTLSAVPFDAASRQVAGAAVGLVENVMQGINAPNGGDETGAGQFAVSSSGTLVYVPGGIGPTRLDTMVWVDRKGTAEPLRSMPPGAYLNQRLSPDGQKIVVDVRHPKDRNTDVWVYDVARGAPTRLTFNGGGQPVWSPDGKRVVYGSFNLSAVQADSAGSPERVTTTEINQIPGSWASNGTLSFLQRMQNGSFGIWTLQMNGDRKPAPLIESRFSLWYGELSPDGRWIAYASNESGNFEVYVQPSSERGEKVRISTNGGSEPVWARAGREILYRSGTIDHQQVYAVGVRAAAPFQAEAPRLLFESPPGEYESTAPTRSWDVSADGSRFLMLKPVSANDRPPTSMNVVLNWTDELDRLVPRK